MDNDSLLACVLYIIHVHVLLRQPFGVEQEYFVQLFLEFDEKVEIPTVGSLLRKTFLEQDFSFTEVHAIYCKD